MKKIYLLLIISVSAILLLSNSCKVEAPEKFDQPDAIYFNTTPDSINYSFAQYPQRLVDTVKIPVTVLGNAVAKDRVIDVQLATDTLSTAVAGVHYKMSPPYILPANSYSTIVPVVVYRTPDMVPGKVFSVRLKLVANNDFKLGITQQTKYIVNISYIQKPTDWGTLSGTLWAGKSADFGTWTLTKYTMILNALYNPVTGSTVTDFGAAATTLNTQYLQTVKNYLRKNYPGNFSTPLGIGATLTDPDANNAIILVGPANY
jgi:Domain of unknown function (DUF4843)